MSPFPLFIPHFLPHLVIFFLDYTFTSALLIHICIFMFLFINALFATLSTFSFPSTPICAGTHTKFTWPSWFVILVTELRVSYSISCRLFECKDLKRTRTDDESEHITTLSISVSDRICYCRTKLHIKDPKHFWYIKYRFMRYSRWIIFSDSMVSFDFIHKKIMWWHKIEKQLYCPDH